MGDSNTVSLRRSIGLFPAIAILLSNTGGESVFIASTSMLVYGGSPGVSLIFWLIGGLINIGLAFCFVEVALLLPKAGGPYYYVKEVFGPFLAFVVLWGFVLSICAPSWALAAYTASLYVMTLLFPDCPPPGLVIKLLAAWFMVTMIVLNCLYMKYVTRVQSLLSAGKVTAMIIIVAACLTATGSTSSASNISAMFDGSTTDPGSIALGLATGYFAFGGWQVITIIIEEVKNPVKNVPRALIITFIILIVLYVLVNFCYFVILSPQDIRASDAVAVLYGYRIHPALAVLISVLVATCAVSVLNSLIMGQPRMVYAAAREGQMPVLCSMISMKYLTPWPATFVLSVPALVVLLSGTVMSMIDMMGLYANLMVCAVLVCLLRLRTTHANVNRYFKVPLILPVFELCVSLSVMFMSVWKKPHELGTCIAVIAAGVPVYGVFIWWESKPTWFTSLIDKWTADFQKLFYLVKPDY